MTYLGKPNNPDEVMEWDGTKFVTASIIVSASEFNEWTDGGNRMVATASISVDSLGRYVNQIGSDIYFYVSGTRGSSNTKKAVFGGDVIISGTLTASNQIYVGTNVVWNQGNDGTGSGLDADLLDGKNTITATQYWDGIPIVGSDGVMEVGRYIDFHNASVASDYDVRLETLSSSTDLYVTGRSPSATGKIWTQTNDGPGSGLDADTLDTIDSTGFLQTGSLTQTKAGALILGSTLVVTGVTTVANYINRTTANGNAAWLQQDGTGRSHWYWNTLGGTSPTFTNASEDASALTLTANNNGVAGGAFFHRSTTGSVGGGNITFITTLYSDLVSLSWRGNTVWHAGNDGAGSGLDADLLDGLNSTAFVTTASSQTISGDKTFSAGLTGSIQRTSSGVSYIVGGTNITTSTASNGQITIAVNTTGLNADTLDTIDSTGFIQTGSLAQTKAATLTISQSSVANSTADFTALNLATSVNLHSKLTPGAWNPLAQLNDSGIIFRTGSMGTGGLIIAPWTTLNYAYRMSGSGATALDVATFALNANGTNILTASNRTVNFPLGLSGSLQRTSAGNPYIISGPNITVTTNSLGQIEITGSAGVPGPTQFTEGTPSPRLRTTASFAVGSNSLFAQDYGSNLVFYVSGSKYDNTKTAGFGGDVRISGSINVGTDNVIKDLATYSSIIGGLENSIISGSENSFIVGGQGATISASQNSFIIGGTQPTTYIGGADSAHSSIINANGSFIKDNTYSTIISADAASIDGASVAEGAPTTRGYNSFIGGGAGGIVNSQYSTMLGTLYSSINGQANADTSTLSAMINAGGSTINDSGLSVVLNGGYNTITNSLGSIIIGLQPGFTNGNSIINATSSLVVGDNLTCASNNTILLGNSSYQTIVSGGLTGSLQRTIDGKNYIIGGPSITVATNSLGQIEISSSITASNSTFTEYTTLFKTGSYTITNSDQLLFVSASTTVTMSLPTSSSQGKFFIIKDKAGNAANNIIVVSSSNSTIDGASTFLLNINYGSVQVVYLSSSWNII